MIRTKATALVLFVSSFAFSGCSGRSFAPLDQPIGAPTPASDPLPEVTLPRAEVGAAYSTALPGLDRQDAQAARLRVDDGELPPGLVLDDSSGVARLHGTPTAAGNYRFTISAGGAASAQLRLPVGSGSRLVDGWTDFTPAPGARIVHVSASGNDAAPGTLHAPRRTLAGGFALLRHGHADWLLLRRGDTFPWTGSFQWNKSGPANGTGWMRLGAYGDESLPRPVLLSQDGRLVLTPGYQSATTIRRVAITDVFLHAADRIANSATTTSDLNGIQLVATEWQGTSGKPFHDILIENCRISGFTFGIATSLDVEDFQIRRCIIDHIFAAVGTHSSGILTGATNLTIEDSVFYRIMSPDIPGLGTRAYSSFAHSMYLTAYAVNVTTRRNIIIKAPDGPMQRSGGNYLQNVSVEASVGGNVGQTWGVTPTPGGVHSRVEENLALNSLLGTFYMGNTASGYVRGNMLLQDIDGQGQTSLMLVGRNATATGVNIGVHNTAFEDNLVSGNISWNSTNTTSYSGLTFSNNQTNMGPTTTSIGSFLQSIHVPGNDVDAWADMLLARDRRNFTQDYLATAVINHYRTHYCLPPVD